MMTALHETESAEVRLKAEMQRVERELAGEPGSVQEFLLESSSATYSSSASEATAGPDRLLLGNQRTHAEAPMVLTTIGKIGERTPRQPSRMPPYRSPEPTPHEVVFEPTTTLAMPPLCRPAPPPLRSPPVAADVADLAASAAAVVAAAADDAAKQERLSTTALVARELRARLSAERRAEAARRDLDAERQRAREAAAAAEAREAGLVRQIQTLQRRVDRSECALMERAVVPAVAVPSVADGDPDAAMKQWAAEATEKREEAADIMAALRELTRPVLATNMVDQPSRFAQARPAYERYPQQDPHHQPRTTAAATTEEVAEQLVTRAELLSEWEQALCRQLQMAAAATTFRRNGASAARQNAGITR
jgi:hypothetical protein